MLSKSEKRNKVLKVGITGGIGSGKSVVAKIFEVLNIPVYNADERARWIQENDPKVIKETKALFGEEAYVNGKLNRSIISQQVFKDKDKLAKLNHIVHPKVGKDFENWTKERESFPYVLKEAALFFEAGSYKDMDRMITVISPLELRIKRIITRDLHRTEDDVKSIIAKQLSDQEKASRSDFVIYNDDEHMLIPQVLEIDQSLRNC
jgi:dephospho-CoA kinase